MRANVGMRADELNLLMLRLVRESASPTLIVTQLQLVNLRGLGVVTDDKIDWRCARALMADLAEVRA